MRFKLAIVVTHPIRYLVPLIQLLTKRGFIQIKVFYTYGPRLLKTKKYNPANRKKEEPGLPIYEGYDFTFVNNTAKKISTYKYSGINNPGLIQEIENWNPSTILVCGWKFKSHLQVLRYFKGKIPVHFRGDSTLLEEAHYNYLKKICRRILLRWVYCFVDKAWYVGLQNKNYYKKMGMKEDQLVFVPHAVDNDRFSRTDELQEKASLLKKQMNIPGDALVFLFAAQMIQRKNVFTLVNVFKQLNLPNGHLLMVGSGKELARLNEMAADESNIHFVPPQSQTSMPVIYSTADVLILPSKEDTWGLVINEAMANGLAIVASDQCGAAFDLIEEGKNGYMFPYRDEERLSEIIKEFCNDPTKVKIMGQYSLKKINNFSYDVAATAIEKLLLHN